MGGIQLEKIGKGCFLLLLLSFWSSFTAQAAPLEPESFWREFAEVTAIYRPSKGERQIAAHVCQKAAIHGHAHRIDATGNVLVTISPQPGQEKWPGVILQCHLDMVCVARPGTEFVWGRDQIRPVVAGDWMHAENTSLGADNGVGIAVMLDIMQNPPPRHGMIELLFTVDEEVDFSGVCGLQPGFLQGKILLNLDSEESGEYNVGCAGGQADILELSPTLVNVPEGYAGAKITISGGQSGHSGVDIHRDRANAIRELFKTLALIAAENDIFLADCCAGVTDTAIPGEAEAIICYPATAASRIEKLVTNRQKLLKKRFSASDPLLKLAISATALPERAMNHDETVRLISVINRVPSGVLAMSRLWPGNVQTSMNPGLLRFENGRVLLTTHLQASTMPVIKMLSQRLQAIADRHKLLHTAGTPYRPWEPSQSQAFLDAAVNAHVELTGQKPLLKVVHAGVECGELKNIFPHIQMLSFGPDIRHAHTPDEKVRISTVGQFVDLVRLLLIRLPKSQNQHAG